MDEGCQGKEKWFCCLTGHSPCSSSPFLFTDSRSGNGEPKDFTSSQERRLNNPPAHLPNGCCGSWSVSSSAQLVFSSFERVTAGSAKPSQCGWRATKYMFKSHYFCTNTPGYVRLFFNLGSWSENQAGDTDHFLWSCFLHGGNALSLQVLLNLLFVHGVNWNAPPQFLEFCKSNTMFVCFFFVGWTKFWSTDQRIFVY